MSRRRVPGQDGRGRPRGRASLEGVRLGGIFAGASAGPEPGLAASKEVARRPGSAAGAGRARPWPGAGRHSRRLAGQRPGHAAADGAGQPAGVPGVAMAASAEVPGKLSVLCLRPLEALAVHHLNRSAGGGQAPWPASRRGLAGRPAGRPARGARAGSSACRCECAALSSPCQAPCPGSVNEEPRPSSGIVLRWPWRWAEHLAGHRTSPAHAHDRRLRVVAELLCYPFGAARAAICVDGRSDGLPDLTRAGFIGALQARRE